MVLLRWLGQTNPNRTTRNTMGRAQLSAEQLAAAEAAFHAEYPTAKPQWSFNLSITLNKPVDVVASKLGGLDNFETLTKLNPLCMGYNEVARDWVVISGPLSNARVREIPSYPDNNAEATLLEGGKKYERLRFEAKDRLTAFWGLLSGVTVQRGTFVWDEQEKIGLWEITTTDVPGEETWARKVVKFVDGGNGNTRIEEFVEGYSKETLQILEGFAKRYTRDLHK